MGGGQENWDKQHFLLLVVASLPKAVSRRHGIVYKKRCVGELSDGTTGGSKGGLRKSLLLAGISSMPCTCMVTFVSPVMSHYIDRQYCAYRGQSQKNSRPYSVLYRPCVRMVMCSFVS